MCVGLADADKIFYSAAPSAGLPVVYFGSKTGRDGIHGATMASAEFGKDSEEKRPTVQVGDPFTEKLLIEACLELMATDAIQSIQDMGAAGLTSSSVEMADKGGVGIEMDLDAVPQRETGMTAYEIMLSESQERMLMILKPGKEAVAKKIFDKWDLDAEVIGVTTTTGRLVLKQFGQVVCDIPVAPLGEDAPNYDRPWTEPVKRPVFDIAGHPEPKDYGAVLLKLMSSPDMASKRWVWEQYDRHVMGDTIDSSQSGGDAAIVRVHGTNKALAICSDCNPHYVAADPYEGGKQVVAEAYRNLSAVGALPIAITDNLNFGNPEKPATMGQIVKAIEGMAEACRTLDFPVVCGNVSLYNETDGKAIPPTPVVGGVGLIEDLLKTTTLKGAKDGDALILIGEATGHLGASLYARVWLDLKGDALGPPPPVDLETEKKNGTFIRALINKGLVNAVHDVSDGGIACAAAEMALASGIGVRLVGNREPEDKRDEACLFGEASALYLVAASEAQLKAWDSRGFMPGRLGVFGGDAVVLETGWGKDAPEFPVKLSDLRAAHEAWLPGYMNAVE
jgi:phosphoribosylformylglycinamidine synthase